MSRRTAFLLLLLLSARTAPAQSDPLPPPAAPVLRWHGPEFLAVRADSLRLSAGQTEVALARPFIGELLAWSIDGRELEEGTDATLARAAGTVYLATPATDGQHLVVRYRYDPLGAPPQMQLHEPLGSIVSKTDEDPSRVPPTPSSEGPSGRPGRLNISGSKTVSVQGGTRREASVDQALQLSISGQLSDGVAVRAEISDENLPVTPEGNTEELSDLDQVRIELYGERGRALVGDFFHRSQPGAFHPFERKLQGLSLLGRADRGEAQLLVGAPRGQRIEVEIRGREGVQGPYELLDGLRLDQSFIVAGSERVWLDGVSMTRGENRDYTIDYIRAELRFTERRPIGNQSRIAIDFESSKSGYSRSVVGAGIDSVALGSARFSLHFFREADDPDRPTDGALSDADRDSLAAAGDERGRAFGDGVVATEPGEGAYVERIGGGGERYFEVADSTGGDFDLFFTRVNEGLGDYVLDRIGPEGQSEFRYVGPGLGDHVIGRKLALPAALSLAAASVRAGAPSAANLQLELDWSDQDLNQLSGRDDGDNGDVAWRLRAQSPWMGGDDEGLRLGGRVEAIGADFASSGRLRAPFFYENWNLQREARTQREAVEELLFETKRGSRSATAKVEHLSRSGSFDGERAEFAGGGSVWRRWNWRHRLAFLRADRDFSGQPPRRSTRSDRLISLHRRGRLQPQLDLFDERFRDRLPASQNGYRIEGYEAALLWPGSEELSARVAFRREFADSLANDAGEWRFAQDARQWSGHAGLNRGAHALQGDFSWRSARQPGDARRESRLGRLRFGRRPSLSSWNYDVEYRVSSEESRILSRDIIFVGINLGDYDAEGNPVGVRQGDYNVVFTPSESLQSATDVELRSNLEWDASLPGLGGVRSASQFEIHERSKSDELGDLLLLKPALLRAEETTLFGEQRVRQEFDLLRDLQRFDLRLSYDRSDQLDQRYLGGVDRRRREREALRLDSRIRQAWSLRWRAEQETRVREGDALSVGSFASYDVRDRVGAIALHYRSSGRQSASVEFSVSRRDENRQELRQDIFAVAPELSTELVRARWNFQARWARIKENESGLPIRPFFFETPGDARSVAVSIQWALGQAFSLGVRYSLRDEAQRELRQDLSVQTRARF